MGNKTSLPANQIGEYRPPNLPTHKITFLSIVEKRPGTVIEALKGAEELKELHIKSCHVRSFFSYSRLYDTFYLWKNVRNDKWRHKWKLRRRWATSLSFLHAWQGWHGWRYPTTGFVFNDRKGEVMMEYLDYSDGILKIFSYHMTNWSVPDEEQKTKTKQLYAN
jgi:hypothetical protein